MHAFITNTDPKTVHVRVSEKLVAADYDDLVPTLEAHIAAHGKIALVWEMRDFHGWSAEGLWADTKFDVRHAGDFSRVALVGETKWQEMMTKLMSPFTSAEVRFFETTDLDDALRWVEQPAEQ